MTVHLDLEELLEMLTEADYRGKITNDVTFVSTKVIFPAGSELFEVDEEWS